MGSSALSRRLGDILPIDVISLRHITLRCCQKRAMMSRTSYGSAAAPYARKLYGAKRDTADDRLLSVHMFGYARHIAIVATDACCLRYAFIITRRPTVLVIP